MSRLAVYWTLASAAALAAAVEPGVAGEWIAHLGDAAVPLELRADGSCIVAGSEGSCTASGGVLVFKVAGGETRYRYKRSAGTLTVSGGDLPQALQFERVGAQSSADTAPAIERPAKREGADTAPVAAAGPGTHFDKEAWGAAFEVPAGWKAGERNGVVLLGSEAEAGLIIVRFLSQASEASLKSDYAKGLNEEGVHAAPSGPVAPFRARGGAGLAGELTGTGSDGSALRVRLVAVQTRHGGALIVAGLTTPPQYGRLKSRVDALAASATFRAPKKIKGDFLAGHYQYYSQLGGSSSYSHEGRINLCVDGRFNRGGETYSSGSAGTATASNDSSGSWSAEGDALAGQVTLRYASGETEVLSYRVSQDPKDRSYYGAAVAFDGRTYQKTGGGACR